MKTSLAIVGIFYDGYYDLWEDFLELYSAQWGDCPYSLYIVNNLKDLDFDKKYNVTVLHAGEDAEYSRKVQTALNEIESDYYLLLLEDFLFQMRIDKDPLEEIIKYMQNNNVMYYRMQMPEFSKDIKKINGPVMIEDSAEYTVSCQPSIWKKDFLRRCIGKRNYNAWIFEGIYCYAQKAHTKEFLEVCRVDYSNPLGIRHLAVQGKLLPNVYSDFVEMGYEFKSKREVLDTRSFKKHLFKQWIKERIPVTIQKIIKKYLKKMSVVDRYKAEIIEEMSYLEIE